MLFITPSLKTSSSLVETAPVQQNPCFLLLGNKKGRCPKPAISLTSRITDKHKHIIGSFTLEAGGDDVLSALTRPGWVLLTKVLNAYSTLAVPYSLFL